MPPSTSSAMSRPWPWRNRPGQSSGSRCSASASSSTTLTVWPSAAILAAIAEPTRPQPTIKSFMRPSLPRAAARRLWSAAMSEITIGLLGFGTVGSAVHRLLAESSHSIERVTGRPVRVGRALVSDPARHGAAPDGLLTTSFADLRDDPEIQVVAEVMGGISPTREHVLELLRAGKSVVSANKQLLARHGEELFTTAEQHGVQLRF